MGIPYCTLFPIRSQWASFHVTLPCGMTGIEISRDGFATLDTHRELKAPLHDWPPLDFILEVLWPGKIIDEYEWTFLLEPYQPPRRGDLIDSAIEMKRRTLTEFPAEQPAHDNNQQEDSGQ